MSLVLAGNLKVLFIFKMQQIPSLEAFIIIKVCDFHKILFYEVY